MAENSRIEWTEAEKRAARAVVNVEVRLGLRPHPNTMPCADCEHAWKPGERRHEYDHHLGYARENWFNVVPVCTTCHAARGPKAQQTHCVHGHEFTAENTRIRANGTRACRTCLRRHDRGRHDAAYWRAYRAVANG